MAASLGDTRSASTSTLSIQERGNAGFQPVKTPRAFDEITAQIRAEVKAGRLKAGSRLPAERVLAEQFGVSRNTLREALRSLEHAGLIRLQKGATGGAFIRESTGDAIVSGMIDMYDLGGITPQQLTEARIWLESLAVRAACERAEADDIAALKENIERAIAAHAVPDIAPRSIIHLEFHRLIAKATRNPIVIAMMDGILDIVARFVIEIGPYDNTFVIPSRQRFMQHFIAREADKAAEEMEESLRHLHSAYLLRASSGSKTRPPRKKAEAQ
jgi:DNA-binding FadR family transcriptional regulator